MKNNQENDVNVKPRKKLKIIAIMLLVIGITLVTFGAVILVYHSMYFFELPMSELSRLSTIGMVLLTPGMFMIIPALFLLAVAHQREILRYTVEETGMALGTADEQALDGYGRVISIGTEAAATGIGRAGGIKLDVKTTSPQKIMIKCRACGTLNDEDAKFCDECGQPL
ncbi:MAG: zinc ribbon domain-containing protein [Candidatus Lokiarchaeota archaeon]|nr:zinc ribbon domain-containing protein [Candidatus Lokiarchaeota archaeon]